MTGIYRKHLRSLLFWTRSKEKDPLLNPLLPGHPRLRSALQAVFSRSTRLGGPRPSRCPPSRRRERRKKRPWWRSHIQNAKTSAPKMIGHTMKRPINQLGARNAGSWPSANHPRLGGSRPPRSSTSVSLSLCGFAALREA